MEIGKAKRRTGGGEEEPAPPRRRCALFFFLLPFFVAGGDGSRGGGGGGGVGSRAGCRETTEAEGVVRPDERRRLCLRGVFSTRSVVRSRGAGEGDRDGAGVVNRAELPEIRDETAKSSNLSEIVDLRVRERDRRVFSFPDLRGEGLVFLRTVVGNGGSRRKEGDLLRRWLVSRSRLAAGERSRMGE